MMTKVRSIESTGDGVPLFTTHQRSLVGGEHERRPAAWIAA